MVTITNSLDDYNLHTLMVLERHGYIDTSLVNNDGRQHIGMFQYVFTFVFVYIFPCLKFRWFPSGSLNHRPCQGLFIRRLPTACALPFQRTRVWSKKTWLVEYPGYTEKWVRWSK